MVTMASTAWSVRSTQDVKSRIRRWSNDRIQLGGGTSVGWLAIISVEVGSGDEATEDKGVVSVETGRREEGGKRGRIELNVEWADLRVEGGKRYGKPWSSTWWQFESRSSRRLDE